MPENDFDFPEMNRIGELLRDVSGATAATAKAAPPPKPAIRSAPAKFRLAATPVGRFAEGANWKNDLAYQSPFVAVQYAVGPRLGAITVSGFGAGANWTNSIGAPLLLASAVDTAPIAPTATLDTFLSEFAWD